MCTAAAAFAPARTSRLLPRPKAPGPVLGGRAAPEQEGHVCSLTPPVGFQPYPHALSEPLVSIGRTPHGLIRFPASKEGRAHICI